MSRHEPFRFVLLILTIAIVCGHLLTLNNLFYHPVTFKIVFSLFGLSVAIILNIFAARGDQTDGTYFTATMLLFLIEPLTFFIQTIK